MSAFCSVTAYLRSDLAYCIRLCNFMQKPGITFDLVNRFSKFFCWPEGNDGLHNLRFLDFYLNNFSNHFRAKNLSIHDKK